MRVKDADSIVVGDVIPSRDRGGGDGGEVLRGARGRADVPPPTGADDHRGRQRLLHLHDDEPAAAPPRLPRRVEGGVRQAAGQQPPDARDRGGALGRRDDSRHNGREPRLRGGRVPEARLPRRYDLRGDRGGGQARVAVASPVGHRHLRAPGEEPARRRRHAGAPERDDAQAGYLMGRRRRALHFVPGGNEKMLLKALALPADGLILDLEDAVPPDRKAATRPVVRDWLSHREFGGRERWVRMNPIWGPLGRAGLEETIRGRPDGSLGARPPPPAWTRSTRSTPTSPTSLASAASARTQSPWGSPGRSRSTRTRSPSSTTSSRRRRRRSTRRASWSSPSRSTRGAACTRSPSGAGWWTPRTSRAPGSCSPAPGSNASCERWRSRPSLRSSASPSASSTARSPSRPPATSSCGPARAASAAPTSTSSRATCRLCDRRSSLATRSWARARAEGPGRLASRRATVSASRGCAPRAAPAPTARRRARTSPSGPRSPATTPTGASPTSRARPRRSRSRSRPASPTPTPRRPSPPASAP